MVCSPQWRISARIGRFWRHARVECRVVAGVIMGLVRRWDVDDLIFGNDLDGAEQIRFVGTSDGVEVVPAFNDEDSLLSRQEAERLRDWLTEWLNETS